MKNLLLYLIFSVFVIAKGQTITASEAYLHTGEKTTVSGIIYGGYIFTNIQGQPIQLIIGDSFPSPVLSILISAEKKVNFPVDPVGYYLNKRVTVTEVVISPEFPQLLLTDSSRIIFTVPVDSSATALVTLAAPKMKRLKTISTLNDCPAYGNTTNPRLRALNEQKNRYTLPGANDFKRSVTLAALLKRGNDEKRWNVNDAVEITGYIAEVKPGGSETCNCQATDPDKIDTHIVLVADPGKTKGKDKVIIEITPRLRYLMSKKNIDWSTKTLRSTFLHKWVRIKGWLFFDQEHYSQAENTNPGKAANWRGTAWEIHPITDIKIIRK